MDCRSDSWGASRCGRTTRGGRVLFAHGIALACLLSCDGGHDRMANASVDGGYDPASDPTDAGRTSSVHCAADAACEATGPAAPGGPAQTAGAICDAEEAECAAPEACQADAECADPLFCNGAERCVLDARHDGDEDAGAEPQGHCEPAAAGPCIHPLACSEELDRCDCDRNANGKVDWYCGGPDVDLDGDNAQGADDSREDWDCDDSDPNIHKGQPERCDHEGIDEDCDPTTVAGKEGEDPLRDRDGDGYVDHQCLNVDRDGVEHRHDSPDCDDEEPEINPGPDIQELCDNVDNNCNGIVDEAIGSGEPYSQQHRFCFDADGDGHSANRPEQIMRACAATPGYVLCRQEPTDCDDDPAHGASAHVGLQEICDGRDNDCDGAIDEREPGKLMADEPTFPDTTAICTKDGWQLTACPVGRLWCDHTSISHGCEADVTRLSRCAGCDTTACRFACSPTGCEEIARLSVGGDFACGLTTLAGVSCWGRGAEGRLGDDQVRKSSVPTRVIGVGEALAIGAGAAHACAIQADDHAVYCWGSNRKGQLGSPEASVFSAVAVPAAGGELGPWLTGVTSLSAGGGHTCGVLQDGRVACWGHNADGQLGDPFLGDETSPARVVARLQDTPFGQLGVPVTDVKQVVAGARHACLLTNQGGVECWGSNAVGQLGSDPQALSARPYPMPVPGLPSDVSELASRGDHTCALAGGRVFCWGYGRQGQLGHAPAATDYLASEVQSLPAIAHIALGMSASCAVTPTQDAYCWGRNLAVDASDSAAMGPTPTKLPLASVLELDLNWSACARTRAGVFCWGPNTFGELGTGQASNVPQPISDPLAPVLGSRR